MGTKPLNANQLERNKKYVILGEEDAYIICRTDDDFFTRVSSIEVQGLFKLTFNQITRGKFVEIKE